MPEQLVDMARLAANMDRPGKKVMSPDSVKGEGIIASDPVKGGEIITPVSEGPHKRRSFQTQVHDHLSSSF